MKTHAQRAGHGSIAVSIEDAAEIDKYEIKIKIDIDIKSARARTGPCLQGRLFAKRSGDLAAHEAVRHKARKPSSEQGEAAPAACRAWVDSRVD